MDIRLRDSAEAEIIGLSSALQRIKAKVPRLAADSGPLVIIGETGVGKALLAKIVHASSPRRDYPLESMNFSLLSEREQRIGLLGGGPPELTTTRRSLLESPTTIVLKHFDNANSFLQEKLVEAFTTRRVVRLGSGEWHAVCSRIILTFRKSLPRLLHEGSISAPLHEIITRFNRVHLPPLRERKEDIVLLAEHFVREFYENPHRLVNGIFKHIQGFDRNGRIERDLAAELIKQKWEDNVTQLKAYVRALILPSYDDAYRDIEKLEAVKMVLLTEEGKEFSLRESLSKVELAIIDRALDKYHGNRAKVGQMLGLSERAVRRRSP